MTDDVDNNPLHARVKGISYQERKLDPGEKPTQTRCKKKKTDTSTTRRFEEKNNGESYPGTSEMTAIYA